MIVAWHEVPGYNRTVPPGQKPFAHRRAASYELALMEFTLGNAF
jgi:hypothetical protein